MNTWSESDSIWMSSTAQSERVMTRSRICPCTWVGRAPIDVDRNQISASVTSFLEYHQHCLD